jgi:hypothetical protein
MEDFEYDALPGVNDYLVYFGRFGIFFVAIL